MSGGWDIGAQLADFQSAVDLVNSTGIAVPSGVSTGTYGPFTTLISSLASDCDLLSLLFNISYRAGFLDIAVGPAGSEKVIIPALPFDYANNFAGSLELPLKLKAGTRLSARQNNTVSVPSTILVSALTSSAGFREAPFDTIDSAVSASFAIGNGAKGAWSQLMAATPAAYSALLLCIVHGSYQGDLILDVGAGAAGSEVAIITNIRATINQYYSPFYLFFRKGVPAGSRLCVRAQGSGSGNDTLYIWGVH